MRVLLQGVPAEPVEDEQHDGARVARDLGEPVAPRPPTSAGTIPATDAPSRAGSTGSVAGSTCPRIYASMAWVKVSTRGDYAARRSALAGAARQPAGRRR